MIQSKNLLLPLFLLILISCAGGKDVLFEQDPPFQIKKATAQDWVSGVQGGGSGTIVTIYMGLVHEELSIQEIYYKDEMAKAEHDSRNIDKYVARFAQQNNRDIIMSEDSKMEAKNTPPVKSPFSLDRNEMVIGYLHDGELKFYKYNEVEEKPIIAYPGAKPDGLNDK